jgi:hypothetical protein
MPGFNQRGPEGQGPMTGRRIGRCTNYGANPKNQNITPYDNQVGEQTENSQGRGFGFGCGRGERRGRGGNDHGIGLQNRYRDGV